jgi:acyl phosphate:glycerol-3-phosphate acyltransferase
MAGWWPLTLASLLGYAIGALSPAAVIAKARGIELRSMGSGNPGATNAGRVMGRKIGYLVGLLDVLKGLAPALIVRPGLGLSAAMVAGVAAVLGHCTSPWLHGRGGKGVATSFGATLGVAPLWAVGALLAFLVVLLITRWVALASVASALALMAIAVVVTWVTEQPLEGQRLAWAVVLGGIVIHRHRANFVARWRGRGLAG